MTSLRHSMNLKNGGVISLVGAGGKTALMYRLARELSSQGDAVLTTTTTKIYTPNRKQSPIVIVSKSAKTFAVEARAILKRYRHFSAGNQLIHFQRKLKGFLPETIDAIWHTGVFRWIIVETDGAAGRALKAPALHEPVIPKCTQWAIGICSLEAVGKPLSENWVFRPQQVSKITGLALGKPMNESAIADVFLSPDGVLKNAPASAKRFVFLNQADSQERLEAGKKIAHILFSHEEAGFTGVVIGQTLYEPPVKAYYSKD